MSISSFETNEYCLRWNHHESNMISFFVHLLAKESLADVTLVSTDGSSLEAHKIVLSACSPYFQQIFEKNPCKHPIVILKDVSYCDLKSVVNFIYNGEINVSQDCISGILATANALQVKGLAEIPVDELKNVGANTPVPQTQPTAPTTRPFASYIAPSKTTSSESTASTVSSFIETPRKRWKKSADTSASSGSESNSTNDKNSLEQSSFSMDAESGPNDNHLGVPGFSKVPSELAVHKSNTVTLTRTASAPSPSEPEPNQVTQVLRKCSSLDDKADNGSSATGNDNNPEATNYDDMSAYRARMRRTRPLLRQHRIIRRMDNEIDRDYEACEGPSTSSYMSVKDNEEDKEPGELVINESPEPPTTEQHTSLKRLPEVRVSQSSPTPPSSPMMAINSQEPEEQSSSEPSKVFTSCSSVPTRVVTTSSLLSVPSSSLGGLEPQQQSSTQLHSQQQQQHTLTTHYMRSSSQTLVSAHSLGSLDVPNSSSGPVIIRRQNSQPNPIQQPVDSNSSSILSGGTFRSKEGTLFQLIPTDALQRGKSEETYFMDSQEGRSLIQIMPSPPVITPLRTNSIPCTIGEGYSHGILGSGIPSPTGDGYNKVAEDNSSRGDNGASSTAEDGQPIHRLGHCPAIRPGPPLGCNFCWNSVDSCGRILRRKTKYHCPECHINLCIVPCFQEYHEKKSKRKIRSKLTKPSSM